MALLGKLTLGAAWLVLASPPGPRSTKAWRAGTSAQDSLQRARALHVLNRLTYGPRPGDVDRVLAMGVDRFIDQQVHPETIDDDALQPWLRRYEVLRMSPRELADVVLQEQQARRARQLKDGQRVPPLPMAERGPGGEAGPVGNPRMSRARRLAGELQEGAVVRAALSQRQLYEVMVDFWTNHFNVFLGKGADRFLLPDFIEHTIRPHALGKFADLLIATTESPAMLFYLDNAESVAPGSTPPQLAQLDRRLQQAGMGGTRGRPRFGRFGRQPDPARLDSLRQRIEQRLPQGIPENQSNKFKTPLEFVVSAVRATGSTPDTTLALAQIVGRLGEPLYLEQPPTGYPESQASWVNSSSLLQRFNLGLGLASGRAPGVTVDVDDLVPAAADAGSLADVVNRVILHGAASANTLKVIREQTADLGPVQARVMAVGLALGSPEFQKQ